MSLVIRVATTTPVRIDIDLDTDAGRIKGHFTGHAYTQTKDGAREMADWIRRLSNWQRHLVGDADDDVTDADRAEFFQVTEANADECLLRRIYDRFEGLANDTGALSGDAAFREVLYGPLSLYLTRAAMDAYWASLNSGGREGNARRQRGR